MDRLWISYFRGHPGTMTNFLSSQTFALIPLCMHSVLISHLSSEMIPRCSALSAIPGLKHCFLLKGLKYHCYEWPLVFHVKADKSGENLIKIISRQENQPSQSNLGFYRESQICLPVSYPKHEYLTPGTDHTGMIWAQLSRLELTKMNLQSEWQEDLDKNVSFTFYDGVTLDWDLSQHEPRKNQVLFDLNSSPW